MQEKEVYLKNKNNFCLIFIFFFLFNTFFSLSIAEENKELYKLEIIKYLNNISEFSSTFIQYDDESFQEGEFFLKKNRFKVQYNSPTKIVIIVKKNNAMYYNVDLSEVQYFNPKKTISKIFFDLFYNKEFLNKAEIEIKNNALNLIKEIEINDEKNIISVIFEKSPLKLRKIEISNSEGKMTFTINNPNYNPDLNDQIFSLANPLLG